MRPILFKFFGINIYSYGTMMAIGILSAVVLLDYRAKKRDYNRDNIFDMALAAIICGILGGKLLYIITDFNGVIHSSDILGVVGSGFVVYGAIIGGAFGVFLYSKFKKWTLLKMLDLAAPCVILAQGIGRIGCFLAGCCYGKETHSDLGVVFTSSPFAPHGIKLIPTQLFSSAFDILVALFLLWYDKKERKDGRVFALYVIMYSIGRFIIEFFRGDGIRGFVGVLSTSQFISIFTLILGLLVFFKDRFPIFNKNQEETK